MCTTIELVRYRKLRNFREIPKLFRLSFAFLGRKCVCGGDLHDTIINFHENLPEKPLEDGFHNAKIADLCLVLGSSLTVTPAANMPQKCVEKGGKLIICNLQKTPLDDIAYTRCVTNSVVLSATFVCWTLSEIAIVV